MNHQPFETWMFEMDQLEPTQAAALNAHLAECPECRRLMESWQAVEYQLKTARPISPAPGFTARWQANLPIRQQREQLQQARQWLWGLGSASLVMAFALVVYLLTTQSPVTMFVNLVEFINGAAIFLAQTQSILKIISDIVPSAVWIILGVVLLVGLVGANLIWILPQLRDRNKGVSRNENFA
jgi:multidrug efflux pump subunit AcrB